MCAVQLWLRQAHIELVQRLSEEIQMALAELFDAKVQAIDALPQNDCCEAAIAEYVQQDTGLNGQTEAADPACWQQLKDTTRCHQKAMTT